MEDGCAAEINRRAENRSDRPGRKNLKMKIHHVGFLTKKLEKSEKEFARMGFSVERPAKYDEIRRIHIEFMVNGGYRVELIQPADKESPIYPLLKNYKDAPYHFCYEVADLEKAVSELEEDRFRVINPPEIAPCIDGKRVCFMMKPAIGMIELVEM